MSFLYTLSNIVVPFSLLIFQTLKRSNDGLKPSYGKWLVLFLLTFIFNGLSIFGRWWILLFDLAAKCSLYFLPQEMNQRIQTQINHLHLEGLIQNFRNRLVNIVFDGHRKITIFLLSKLRNQEAAQFKQAIVKSLNNTSQDLAAGITALPKIFQSTGTNCIIISEDAVEKSLIKRQLEQKKGDIQKRISPESKRSDSGKKIRPQKQSSGPVSNPRSSKQYFTKDTQMHKSQPLGFGNKKDGISSKLKDSFGELRQSSNIIVDEFEEDMEKDKTPIRVSRHIESNVVHNKQNDKPKLLTKQAQRNALQKHKQEEKNKQIAKKQALLKKPLNEQKVQTSLKRRITDISAIKNLGVKEQRRRSLSPEINQQVKMIQKLDVSVSEYSDLFQDDKEQEVGDINEEAKQICRVEAIVEIGAPPQSKLQIYNLELYSNSNLRIMSLYNREFQRHKLVSMTKGQNNYFELHFLEGTINKRKVKFRGQYQPFMKYLQQL